MKNLILSWCTALCMGLASYRGDCQPMRRDTVRVWIPYADADVLDMRLEECERTERLLREYRRALAVSDSLIAAKTELGNAYWQRGEAYRKLAEHPAALPRRRNTWKWLAGAFLGGVVAGSLIR